MIRQEFGFYWKFRKLIAYRTSKFSDFSLNTLDNHRDTLTAADARCG